MPYAAGGASDSLARLIAEPLAVRLGVPVAVENRPGQGGLLGAQAAARAAPDGQTLLLHSSAIVYAAASAPYRSFNPSTALTPVASVAELPSMLVVHPSVPARDVAGLLRHIRESPAPVICGVLGENAADHAGCRILELHAGRPMAYEAYRGLAQLNLDLLEGAIQVNIGALPLQMSHVREGRLRALAVASEERLPEYPDLPTLRESGLDIVGSALNALFAPAGTPPAVVARLHAEVAAILAAPEMRERITATGARLGPADLAALGARFRQEWELATGARPR